MEKEHHSFLYGILAAFFLSLLSLCVKFAAVPVATIVFFRFCIGFLILLPWFLRPPVSFSIRDLPKHLMRSIAGMAALYCFFYSLSHLSLINAMTLSNTAPLFIPLVVFFFLKVIVPKRRVIALCVGFLGVLFILRPTGSILEERGAFVGLFGGLCAAVAFVSLRQLTRTEPAHTILLNFFLLAIIISLVPMIVMWEPIEKSESWLALLGVGIFGAIYQYCLTKSYTHAPATKASLLSYLGLIFGGGLGWFFFNETPSIWDLCGAVLILLGGVIALFDRTKPKSWRS